MARALQQLRVLVHNLVLAAVHDYAADGKLTLPTTTTTLSSLQETLFATSLFGQVETTCQRCGQRLTSMQRSDQMLPCSVSTLDNNGVLQICMGVFGHDLAAKVKILEPPMLKIRTWEMDDNFVGGMVRLPGGH